MKFELHVTVAPTVDVLTFLRWCHQSYVKPLLIELDRGKHKLQPMLAVSTEFGTDAQTARVAAYKWAREWEDKIRFFEIVRSKLECEYTNKFACSYYEIHWKIPEGKFAPLGPPSSRNLLTGSRYITHRFLTYGDVNKAPVFDMPNHIECVLYDTNPKLDKDWCEKPSYSD